MKYSLAILLSFLLVACGDGKKEASEQLAGTETAEEASWTLDLSADEMPLIVDLGDRANIGSDSAVSAWNEEFGHLLVKAGDRFAITITEAPGDLARLKGDLDRDMLQKHTVIEETPDLLIYRSQFPDEDLVFVHFRRVITVGDRTFVVEDAAEGKFNETDIKRMANAVKAKEVL